MKRILAFAAIVLLIFSFESCKKDDPATGSGASQKDALLQKARTVVDSYISRAKTDGFNPSFTPQVTVETTPMLSAYGNRKILIPYWPEVDNTTQALFSRWAGYIGTTATGQGLFENLFNGYFIAHEATHYLAEACRRNFSQYASERHANNFAVAFWLTRPNGAGDLTTLMQQVQPILAHLSDPKPAGADEETWFNANYNALLSNPEAYGYYQFKFITYAYNDRSNLDFDAMVRWMMQ